MAEIDVSATSTLVAHDFWWGELIRGSKRDLQNIGIGKGMLFPGEPGAPPKQMTVTDPRGLRASVSRADWWNRVRGEVPEVPVYEAKIVFADRKKPNCALIQHAPGVVRKECVWQDYYLGSAQALADAGLLRLDELPGLPGRHKTRVRVAPDGEVWGVTGKQAPTKFREAGAREISFARRGYEVTMHLDVKFAEKRRDEKAADSYAFEKRAAELPRPAPLIQSVESRQSEEAKAKLNFDRLSGLAAGPLTAKDFRTQSLARAENYIGLLSSIVLLPIGPFALELDDEDREALEDAFDGVREVLATANIARDAKLLAEVDLHLRAGNAHADEPFQAFLQKVGRVTASKGRA